MNRSLRASGSSGRTIPSTHDRTWSGRRSGSGKVPVVVLQLLAPGGLGDAPRFEEVPGLPLYVLPAAEQVLLAGDLESKRLFNPLVGCDVLDLHARAPPNRDVGVDPQRALLLGIKDAEVFERGAELVEELPRFLR